MLSNHVFHSIKYCCVYYLHSYNHSHGPTQEKHCSTWVDFHRFLLRIGFGDLDLTRVGEGGSNSSLGSAESLLSHPRSPPNHTHHCPDALRPFRIIRWIRSAILLVRRYQNYSECRLELSLLLRSSRQAGHSPKPNTSGIAGRQGNHFSFFPRREFPLPPFLTQPFEQLVRSTRISEYKERALAYSARYKFKTQPKGTNSESKR